MFDIVELLSVLGKDKWNWGQVLNLDLHPFSPPRVKSKDLAPSPSESAVIAPEAPPPPVLNLAELDETGLRFKNSIVSVLSPSGGVDVQKILDRRKEFSLMHSL